jgi:rod shape-determining protein MreD
VSVVRYLAFLLLVVALHALGVRLYSDFTVYVDLFLVMTVGWAFTSNPLVGLAAGMVTGLTADGFAGGPYGLNGFANTLIGYSAAVAVANLAKMNISGAAILYALAAVVQQLVLLVLVLVMLPNPEAPALLSLAWKVGITAALGAVVFLAQQNMARLMGRWRRSRDARLRF